VGGRNLLWQSPPPALWKADLVVVEQATQLLLNYLLLLRRHAGGPPVGFWGHGTSPYRDAHRAGEAVKRLVSAQPDWWFAYTDGVVDRVMAFGFPRDRITSVRNATDTSALAAEVEGVSDEESSDSVASSASVPARSGCSSGRWCRRRTSSSSSRPGRRSVAPSPSSNW
jgi:hypothetical protein